MMLQENPEISLENVNKIFDMQKEFSGPLVTSGFIIIFNLFFGFIISLVVGLILKKISARIVQISYFCDESILIWTFPSLFHY